MLRKCLIATCCLTLLLCGCGKDEPAPEPPDQNEPPEPSVQVPRGMKALSVDPPVFMSTRPLTRGQYIEYLTAMRKTVPAHHAGAPSSEPIVGITREQAARVAIWNLKRLPTREEWQKADEIVDDAPWPWPEEDLPSTEPVYLVQDWTTGSTGEQEALEAKLKLKAGAGLKTLENELEAERKLLQNEMDRFRAEHLQLWAQAKPALFSMLEARRDLAAKRERVKAKESLKTLLSRMGLVKGKAAVKVLNSDASTAEQTAALNKYEELLATQREKTAAEIEEYAQASGALQQQSQALTAALEEYGKTVAAALPRAEAVLETTADTGETVEDVQRQLGYVQDTMAALKAREPDLPGLPGVQELEARTAELRQQADAVETPEGLADDIEKITQKLEDFGERIGQPFEQEPLLLEEQQKLLDARATHAGLEARVETLKNLMARIEAEQADLEDTGETDGDEASVEEPAADDDAAPAE